MTGILPILHTTIWLVEIPIFIAILVSINSFEYTRKYKVGLMKLLTLPDNKYTIKYITNYFEHILPHHMHPRILKIKGRNWEIIEEAKTTRLKIKKREEFLRNKE